ncbi:MAG TPA: acetyl-CoA decarbonylase/synthase complex subunit gamma [Methanobacterium sp.]|nr:acetyl-CoA decarbonylase/synthase complex subunit gamma [Methanobacterium sp.]
MRATAMDIYRSLPKTNCAKCGEASCMAFATKLSEKEADLNICTQMTDKEREKLEEVLAPAVREVVIGTGENAITIGGDEVLYRYELTYYNPTSLVIEVSDDLNDDEFDQKVKKVEEFEFERTGEKLKLNAIAIRNKSGSTEKFTRAVEKLKNSRFPLILCSFNPESMEAALKIVGDKRPLIYAATENNLEFMANLAREYECPITLFVPHDLEKMKELSWALRSKEVKDVVLDPGTFVKGGTGDTLDEFIMIRRLAVEKKDPDFRFPIMGVPAIYWLFGKENDVVKGIRESITAAKLMNSYADILIIHGTEMWELIPVLTLRQSLYTDPRKPQAVDAGLYEFGDLDENSPIIVTTNFALTYYTVEGDLKSGKANCYLLVVDTGGRAVDVAVAGNQYTGKAVAELIKEVGIEEKVNHRKLIIPGLGAPVSGEIEDDTGWEVMVGPRDSSEVSDFLGKLAEESSK